MSEVTSPFSQQIKASQLQPQQEGKKLDLSESQITQPPEKKASAEPPTPHPSYQPESVLGQGGALPSPLAGSMNSPEMTFHTGMLSQQKGVRSAPMTPTTPASTPALRGSLLEINPSDIDTGDFLLNLPYENMSGADANANANADANANATQFVMDLRESPDDQPVED